MGPVCPDSALQPQGRLPAVTDRPLRIGVVCYPTVGGSGVVATEIAVGCAKAGHEVHLLSYDRPGRMQRGVPGLRYHQVQVSAYPLFRFPPYDLALATRMLEVQEEADLDLFHVHYAIPHAISAVLAREMGRGRRLRFATTLHGTDITVVGADRAYMRPTSFALDASDAITAVSPWLAEETSLLFGTRQPIQVIPNFVDTERFRPGERGPWYARNEEERVLVHTSNFRPVKRVADIVRAFARIRREVPARLVLVGDGPDREHALAVASDLGCIDGIHAPGNVEAIETVLQDADLFLMASETESFGLSMLEAMSCGVPGVATAVGGLPEVVGDGGTCTEPANPAAMADAAVALLSDEESHRRHGLAARTRAVDHYRQEIVLEQYLDLYRSVRES